MDVRKSQFFMGKPTDDIYLYFSSFEKTQNGTKRKSSKAGVKEKHFCYSF